jgi:hypothetical protein
VSKVLLSLVGVAHPKREFNQLSFKGANSSLHNNIMEKAIKLSSIYARWSSSAVGLQRTPEDWKKREEKLKSKVKRSLNLD